MSRRLAVLAGVLAALVVAPSAQAAERTWSTGDYWTFADRIMSHLDSWWDPGRDAYILRGALSVRVNSALLLTHAVAARSGHAGPTRQDARARILVGRLTSPPVWMGASGRGRLSTCWSRDLDRVKPQHPSLEPKVAEALARAWEARAELRLSSVAVARIERLVDRCARSAAWRRVRVANQINWNAELYAADAAVTGHGDLLRHRYRDQLTNFALDRRNFGAGFQFHYQPRESPNAGINLDSPEYASIAAHALGHYEIARRHGMRPLARPAIRRLRAWVRRLIAGSWTHAGYLNWDTGKGRRRWHSAQYWAFAQQGLLAIATTPVFSGPPSYARWAKAMFDHGLELYQRRADANGGLAPKRMFGVHGLMEQYDCFCARMIANAARAVALDLEKVPSAEPPPLFAFDPDSGRLAVTTPRYSTAIVPDNRGVFPYGGIDLARLFGSGQRVAANVGGVPPAAFGIVVGRRLASQHTRAGRLRVVHPRDRLNGPFKRVDARGTVRRAGVRIRARHQFFPGRIESAWRVTCAGRCRDAVHAQFPSWGRETVIQVTRRDGTRAALSPGKRIRLSRIVAVDVGSGYRIVPERAPRGATVAAVRVDRQPTDPHPGPTARITLARHRSFHDLSLAVRIEPDA